MTGVWSEVSFGGSAPSTSKAYPLDTSRKKSNYDPLEKRAQSSNGSYDAPGLRIGTYTDNRKVIYVERTNGPAGYLGDGNSLRIDENSFRPYKRAA